MFLDLSGIKILNEDRIGHLFIWKLEKTFDKLGVKSLEIAASELDVNEVQLSLLAFIIRPCLQFLSDHPVDLSTVEPLSSLSLELLFCNGYFSAQFW